ncbi:MAG: helix-turn-helix domain-containing protein [Gammaproteobacteria bacterium]
MRCHILETALQLFSRNGYFNTSVHDIRRAGGISIGAIDHHFPGKEAIASALYEELVDRMDRVMVDIMADHRAAHDRCRAVVGDAA